MYPTPLTATSEPANTGPTAPSIPLLAISTATTDLSATNCWAIVVAVGASLRVSWIRTSTGCPAIPPLPLTWAAHAVSTSAAPLSDEADGLLWSTSAPMTIGDPVRFVAAADPPPDAPPAHPAISVAAATSGSSAPTRRVLR